MISKFILDRFFFYFSTVILNRSRPLLSILSQNNQFRFIYQELPSLVNKLSICHAHVHRAGDGMSTWKDNTKNAIKCACMYVLKVYNCKTLSKIQIQTRHEGKQCGLLPTALLKHAGVKECDVVRRYWRCDKCNFASILKAGFFFQKVECFPRMEKVPPWKEIYYACSK